MSLPNLILNAPVFPEFLQHAARPATLAATLSRWIEDTPVRARILEQLDSLPALLGGGGATDRAAKIIVNIVRES
jgi:lipid-A-disaccharide synthase